MGRWSRALATPFLEFVGFPDGGEVLDAGCGTGSLTLALADLPSLKSIEAIDFEDDFLAVLRGRTTDPRIRAVRGDVCALPYGDRSFDAAYSLLVLHFVSDAHGALLEMRRVLRPGGIAGATVWAYGGMPGWRLFWDTVRAIEPDASAQGLLPGKRPLTGDGELLEAFRNAGFQAVTGAKLSVAVEYAAYDDFWYPMVYGQGEFGTFFDGLPEPRRARLKDAMRVAYLEGVIDERRAFINTAWAVRGIA